MKKRPIKQLKYEFRKKEIDRAVAAVLSIPSAAVNLFTHPLMQELFFVLDPKYPVNTMTLTNYVRILVFCSCHRAFTASKA